MTRQVEPTVSELRRDAESAAAGRPAAASGARAPGLVADLRIGVEGDQQALAPGQASPEVMATFAEALRILRLAQGG